eukprot:gene6924-7470_t
MHDSAIKAVKKSIAVDGRDDTTLFGITNFFHMCCFLTLPDSLQGEILHFLELADQLELVKVNCEIADQWKKEVRRIEIKSEEKVNEFFRSQTLREYLFSLINDPSRQLKIDSRFASSKYIKNCDLRQLKLQEFRADMYDYMTIFQQKVPNIEKLILSCRYGEVIVMMGQDGKQGLGKSNYQVKILCCNQLSDFKVLNLCQKVEIIDCAGLKGLSELTEIQEFRLHYSPSYDRKDLRGITDLEVDPSHYFLLQQSIVSMNQRLKFQSITLKGITFHLKTLLLTTVHNDGNGGRKAFNED